MHQSHVYVIMGDITHLQCDAWMLPSDSKYAVEPHWTGVVGLEAAVKRSRQDAYSNGHQFALPLSDWNTALPMPILTAVPLNGFSAAADLKPRIEAFIRAGAAASRQRQAGTRTTPTRPNPLLAMPSFGSDGGGGRLRKGDILSAILEQARVTGAEEGVDVVLVLKDQKSFALAQVKRRSSEFWSELSDRDLLDQAKDLAAIAKTGRLVPFMGAGTSVSAGAPSWKELIAELSWDLDLAKDERAALLDGDLDARDQAAYLRARFDSDKDNGEIPSEQTFNDSVIRHVDLPRYGLAPALLAGLRTEQAITLNYDTLFELASADVGDPRTVIPDSRVNGDHWLLKLHGSVTDPESIVLTRDDYLGYNASREALSAVVKATLITHHLLFVGFGLRDDHFHEIIHDVRRAMPQNADAPETLATALTLKSSPLNDMLWQNKLNLVSMGGPVGAPADIPTAARTLEIFLDALLAFSTDSHSYLLADEYLDALEPDERSLREAILEFVGNRTVGERSSAAWPGIAQTLTDLGLPGDQHELRPRCPLCGEASGVPILYGMVGSDVQEDLARGAVVLGGCIVSGANPSWHCMKESCQHEWA